MTGTTKTRRELVSQALANLGVLAAGQTPGAEDFAAVDAHVDPVIAQLAIEITDIDVTAIPVELFHPVSVILADDAALEFGLPGVPATLSNPNPVLAAETKLRRLTHNTASRNPVETDYF